MNSSMRSTPRTLAPGRGGLQPPGVSDPRHTTSIFIASLIRVAAGRDWPAPYSRTPSSPEAPAREHSWNCQTMRVTRQSREFS